MEDLGVASHRYQAKKIQLLPGFKFYPLLNTDKMVMLTEGNRFI